MRKLLALPPVLLCLLLSACGDADTLWQEKETLRQEIETLTAENAALTEENAALTEENAALAGSSGESNPIDAFFASTDMGSSTMEMNRFAALWARSWETEARSAAEWLKSQLPLPEDRGIVDDYLTGAEAQVQRMDVMAVFSCADLSLPFEERMRSSGSIRGVLWAGAYQQVWRDTFYQLVSVAPDWGLTGEGGYSFVFDAEAAQAELAELNP